MVRKKCFQVEYDFKDSCYYCKINNCVILESSLFKILAEISISSYVNF